MIRWDELCMYCPLYQYCSDTLGDTCEYPKYGWRDMRNELMLALAELDAEEEYEHGS